MSSYSFGMQPGPFTGPGCIINNTTRTAFGFRRTRTQPPTPAAPASATTPRRDTPGSAAPGRIRRAVKNIGIGIAVTTSSFVIAAATTLGLIKAGYDKDAAATTTVAASEVAIAATIAAIERAERRRRHRETRTAQPSSTAAPHLPPSLPAPAADQPAGAN
ncbi:hypothetical protein ACWD5W_00075 [Streptomyces sp. NPDC002455]